MSEIQGEVAFYLTLPKRIAKFNRLRAQVSRRFYEAHSFIGGGVGIDGGLAQYGIRPDVGALEIIAEEEAYQRAIDKLERRWNLFLEEFTQGDLELLSSELSAENMSHIVNRAYDWIKEIELYLEGHREAVNDEMEEEASLIYLSVLQDLEDELEELFG
jgi:hypothetical protein